MNKSGEQSSILHDAYFNKPPRLTRLFLVRLVLLCGLSFFSAAAVSELYFFNGDILYVSLSAAAAAGILYILASVFPSWIVYLLSFGALGTTFFSETLRDKLLFFYDFVMMRLNSRLLKTDSLLYHKVELLKNGTYDEKLAEGAFSGFIMLGILMAMLYVMACRTRIRPFYTFFIFGIIAVPTFAAEIAGFHYSLIPFAAFFFALYAVRMAYELDGVFVFDKHRAAADAARRNERSYRRRMIFSAFGRKLRGDIPRYLKYNANSIIVLIITAGIMLGTAKLIPEGVTFDYERVFSGIRDVGYTAAEKIENVFDKNFDVSASKARDEYFSYSSYGDNSGGIGITNPVDSERPVLDVTLQRNDIPVYLRGDIGVDFNGTGWTALKDEASLNNEWQAIEKFYPEAQYQITRQKLSRYGYDPDGLLPLQKVSVTYRRRSGVVFQPMTPFELDYKDNGYFDSFGDTVYRVKSGKAYLNSYEALALTPDMAYEDLTSFLGSTNVSYFDYVKYDWSVPGNMTAEEYSDYIAAYESYVENTYTDTDYDVSGLMNELKNGAYISDYMSRYNIAEGVCRYFKENFSYSLTADNGSSEELIDNFLYETKEGHCALFATSAVLALRSMEIPARYVTGYVVQGEGTANKDGYSYVMREKDLHAWIEVYFKGVGWLPFDPTAAVDGFMQTEPQQTRPQFMETETTTVSVIPEATAPNVIESTTKPEHTTELTTTGYSDTTIPPDSGDDTVTGDIPYAPSGEDGGFKLSPVVITVIVVIIAVAILILSVYLFIKRLNRAESRVLGGFRKKKPDRAVEEMYKLVMVILEKNELIPGCEMSGEFSERVDASAFMKGTNVFMVDVMPVFIKSEFGNHEFSPVTEEERAMVYKFTVTLYKKFMDEKSTFGRFIIKISLFL